MKQIVKMNAHDKGIPIKFCALAHLGFRFLGFKRLLDNDLDGRTDASWIMNFIYTSKSTLQKIFSRVRFLE